MAEQVSLYGFSDNDRSGKVRWTACELGLPVKEERLTPGDHFKKEYASLNPYRHVPTALFQGETLRESTAICHALAEGVSSPKLWIGPGEPGRHAYLYWLAVFGETFEARLVECAVSKIGILPPAYFELHEKGLRRKLGAMLEELPQAAFLAGDRFTIADIVAGYNLRLAIQTGLVEAAAVAPYLDPLRARPAAIESRVFASLGAS